jgi:hypothetical protein
MANAAGRVTTGNLPCVVYGGIHSAVPRGAPSARPAWAECLFFASGKVTAGRDARLGEP